MNPNTSLTAEDAEVLIDDAIAILRAGWCRLFYATTESGNVIHVNAIAACKFCATGAIMRALSAELMPIYAMGYGLESSRKVKTVSDAFEEVMHMGIIDFNDFVAKDVDDVIWASEKTKQHLTSRGDG